jgi:hypothetical protein
MWAGKIDGKWGCVKRLTDFVTGDTPILGQNGLPFTK